VDRGHSFGLEPGGRRDQVGGPNNARHPALCVPETVLGLQRCDKE
jgi:hypothetical protein